MESVKVRLRLAGRKIYEQPVSLSPGHQLPKIGDLIEAPVNGRVVRAQVTSTCSPICRERDLVTYVVYASQVEREGRKLQNDGSPMPPASAVLVDHQEPKQGSRVDLPPSILGGEYVRDSQHRTKRYPETATGHQRPRG